MFNNNNNVDNNRQLNPRQFQNRNKQYKNRYLENNNNTQQNSTHTETICNYCKEPGHLVRDCEIRPNKQLKTSYQGNSKALPSTGALRKA